MNKLINNAKKLDTLFKVLQKIIVIGMTVVLIVTAILTVINLIDPDAVIGEDFNVIDIGSVSIVLEQEYALNNGMVLAYAWTVIITALIGAAAIYYGLSLIRKILRPMTEGRPFDSSVGYNIRKLGYVALILGVLQNIGTAIETIAVLQTFKHANLISTGAVQSFVANYTVDLTFLVVFFLLLLISHIFNYGAELQQLSDETL